MTFTVDFFGIGAPKCASTWLAACLAEHPQICMSEPKEKDHFSKRFRLFPEIDNPRYMGDQATYEACFAHWRPGQIRGEFSVQTMHNHKDTPKDLITAYPDAKILVVLRDPVKRMYSHYWHRKNLHGGDTTIPETFEAGLQDPTFWERNLYAKQLAGWMKHIPKERFWVGLDMDLRADPLAYFQDCCRHLGVDDSFVPPSLERRINEQYTRRGIVKKAWYLGERLGITGLGRNRVVKGLLERWDKKSAPYPPMDPALRPVLIERLLPDIEKLEKLLDRDLSAWKS